MNHTCNFSYLPRFEDKDLNTINPLQSESSLPNTYLGAEEPRTKLCSKRFIPYPPPHHSLFPFVCLHSQVRVSLFLSASGTAVLYQLGDT